MRRSVTSGRFLPRCNAEQAPLLCARVKSAPHVKAEATKRDRQHALVWQVKAQIDRELGR